MQVEEVVDAVPGVAEDVFTAEVVELAGVDHEVNERAFVFLQGFVDEPDGFEERDVDVGSAMQDEEGALKAVNVRNG